MCNTAMQVGFPPLSVKLISKIVFDQSQQICLQPPKLFNSNCAKSPINIYHDIRCVSLYVHSFIWLFYNRKILFHKDSPI